MPYQTGTSADYRVLLDDLIDFATADGVDTASPSAGGTGYVVGDVLTASGGTFHVAATFEVTTVGGSGDVTGLKIIMNGGYTSNPSSPVSTTGGTGSGCTVTVTFASNGWTLSRRTQEGVSATVSAGGTGYSVSDQLTIVGGTFGTAAVFNVDSESGGAVTAVSLVTAGDYADTPSNPASTSGGTGSGATLNVTYQDVTTSQEKEVILEGEGSGSDQIYAGIRTFNDSGGSGARNWELAGFTGFGTALTWENQLGISAGRFDGGTAALRSGSYVPLNNATITYWFFVNGNRLIGVFKMGTTYTNMYLGWIDRFATDTDYPYPFLVMGCSTDWARLFSSTAIGYRGMTEPIGDDGDATGPGQIRDSNGVWQTIQNSRTSGGSRSAQTDRIVWPAGALNDTAVPAENDGQKGNIEGDDVVPNSGVPGSETYQIRATPDTGGDLAIRFPATILESNPNQIAYGEMNNVFWVSAHHTSSTMVSEDTLTEGSDTFLVFQNCNATDPWAFFCIKRE